MVAATTDALSSELEAINPQDAAAVRALAARLEAHGDPAHARAACERSRAVREAVGRLRAEALGELLAQDDREAFITRAADPEYMAPVDLAALKVPRFLAVASHACPCGAALLVPFDKQGGPGFPFACPACAAPFLARPAYDGSGGSFELRIEVDTRPAKKRRKRAGVL